MDYTQSIHGSVPSLLRLGFISALLWIAVCLASGIVSLYSFDTSPAWANYEIDKHAHRQ